MEGPGGLIALVTSRVMNKVVPALAVGHRVQVGVLAMPEVEVNCSSPDSTRRPNSDIAMDADPNVEDDHEEAKMAFPLTTTKAKHVSWNNEAGTVDMVKVSTCRQCMNRQAYVNTATNTVHVLVSGCISIISVLYWSSNTIQIFQE
ncbi:hypothetical protein PSTG_16969 [Puccinia striiformis f. sp. tritici PST-78]|uniref:Uncharacterized protein n=1 Tax=Puccinia striiformis f. sp. tritici PST-78 TaxID=1165861 RepID=A0A0L0URQ2_9BASI|nr:hypothetical protein PSTG_16969 [Puccinia striiformis f. sp. tritici PST-78]